MTSSCHFRVLLVVCLTERAHAVDAEVSAHSVWSLRLLCIGTVLLLQAGVNTSFNSPSYDFLFFFFFSETFYTMGQTRTYFHHELGTVVIKYVPALKTKKRIFIYASAIFNQPGSVKLQTSLNGVV